MWQPIRPENKGLPILAGALSGFLLLFSSFCTQTIFLSGTIEWKQKKYPVHYNLAGYTMLLKADGQTVCSCKIDSSSHYEMHFTSLDYKRFDYYITDGIDSLLLRSESRLTTEGGEKHEEERTHYFILPKTYQYQNKVAVCPVCNKIDSCAQIVYGDGYEIKKNGPEIIPGGCLISPISPNWYCKRDKVHY